MKLFTIGGYGFDAASFVDTLRTAGVDCLVDIRMRRGMRGSQYAFLNKSRLEASLGAAGIQYLHEPRLAPTRGIRDRQKAADAEAGEGKRDRSQLSTSFVEAYTAEVLANYPPQDFLALVGAEIAGVALFCVERGPSACHRSLAANHLHPLHMGNVGHLMPAR